MSTSSQSQNGENFKVLIRMRPLSAKQKEQIGAYEQFYEAKKRCMSKGKLSPIALAFYNKYRNVKVSEMMKVENRLVSVYDSEYKNTERKFKQYLFNHVHGMQDSNLSIFEQSLKGQVLDVFDGYNCSIMAYGITGSGKTYSIFGHPKIEQDKGLSHLAFEEVLRQKQVIEEENSHNKVSLSFSFIEIYNENIKDLLSEDGKKIININEDSKGSIVLTDVKEVPVDSFEQVSTLIYTGSTKRIFACTNYNKVSSRSHAVLRLNIEVTTAHEKVTAKLFIIDLAGSEKIQMDNSLRKSEGANINKSLLSLGNCINALADSRKPNTHIPYRDSKLTRLLKDSLGGNARTIMIGCISPHPFTIQQTITTLNYAERAQGIRKQALRNITHSQSSHICSLCQSKMHDKQTNERQAPPDTFISSKLREIEAHPDRNLLQEILQQIYNDILENTKEEQKLGSLKLLSNSPQIQTLYQYNMQEKAHLKQFLFEILTFKQKGQQKINQPSEEENKQQKLEQEKGQKLGQDWQQLEQKKLKLKYYKPKIPNCSSEKKSLKKKILLSTSKKLQRQTVNEGVFTTQVNTPEVFTTEVNSPERHPLQSPSQQAERPFQQIQNVVQPVKPAIEGKPIHRRRSRSKFEVVKKPVLTERQHNLRDSQKS